MDFKTGYQKGFLKRTREHWLLRSDARLYGSGRAAFLDIAKLLANMGVKRLWIPAWQCCEVMASLNEASSLELHFYEVDADLVPTSATINKLDSEQDALLIVDYFASISESALIRTINGFKGQILLDAVHSWLLSDLSQSLPGQITLISGFRKLFWKAAGAIVTGRLAKKLQKIPLLSIYAAPDFPRNMSLRPRFGFLSISVLSFLNLSRYDQIAGKWHISGERGCFSALRSPVKLMPTKNGVEGWLWPDLWREVPKNLKEHAEYLKQFYRVIWR